MVMGWDGGNGVIWVMSVTQHNKPMYLTEGKTLEGHWATREGDICLNLWGSTKTTVEQNLNCLNMV